MTNKNNILIKNIYYMLSYAFTSLKHDSYEDVTTENFENIHNLFAAILAKGVSRQLKQGLHKEYIGHSDDIGGLRGKLSVQGTLKHKFSHKRLLACEYDELTENNLLNQILKTTIHLLSTLGDVDSKYKEELRKSMLFLSTVDSLNPRSISWSGIQFQRNNQSYQLLIGICYLIIEGLLLGTESGTYKMATFLDEQQMHRLYEKFILEFYRKECPDLHVTSSQIPWFLDDGYAQHLPVMQTDIMLRKNTDVLIIDAKYYQRTMQSYYDTRSIHSNHIYQIFTYVKNYQALHKSTDGKVSGLILYAATDEQFLPNETYKMSGNRISVQALNLNKHFSEISEQLKGIAYTYFNPTAIKIDKRFDLT